MGGVAFVEWEGMMKIALLSLCVCLLGCPDTPDYASARILFYTGVSGTDSLYPEKVILRNADRSDSVIIMKDDSVGLPDIETDWFSEKIYDMEELPFDGDGFVEFSIDSIQFELPAEFKTGYRFAMTLKIGGSNTYFGHPVENSYPLPIGVAGVDSLYLVSQDNFFMGSY
ncbi:MAG: hypothetical protein AUK31_03945 [Fibrobacteres bacterium CG2_30_45_31]|nr:MAG: hypothetical protein AUK31_03945 [Fibrobacteres bacterium CG2_30_45_31]